MDLLYQIKIYTPVPYCNMIKSIKRKIKSQNIHNKAALVLC